MLLTDFAPGQRLAGVEPNQIVTVVAAVPAGETVSQLLYRLPNGDIRERLLTTEDAAPIAPATAECPFAFDGDGAEFQLVCEAKRIDLAFLFDPLLAVPPTSTRCRTRSQRSMTPCCRVSRCASSWPMTPALARPSWPGSTSASCCCAPMPSAS
ncbi:hypothetical protein [Thiorhodovibrio winogradskyi]|uniref:hypothetical protein n=1 Tax=Thiorhodovibrio winogradskyi TaxID=77007 RepID=UPI002E2C80C5|nr:hypothetical protein [Thiorhodovibrio winogradskyi]